MVTGGLGSSKGLRYARKPILTGLVIFLLAQICYSMQEQTINLRQQSCPSGCSECNILNECFACSRGFWLEGTKCAACSQNCVNCDSIDQCQECKPKFEVNNGNCTPLSLSQTGKTVVVVAIIVMLSSFLILSVVWLTYWRKKRNISDIDFHPRPSKAHLLYTSDDNDNQDAQGRMQQRTPRDSNFIQTAEVQINNTIDHMEADPSRYSNWSARPSHPPKHQHGSFGPEDIWGGGDFKGIPKERSATRMVSGILVPASLDDVNVFRHGTEKPHSRPQEEFDGEQISASLKV